MSSYAETASRLDYVPRPIWILAVILGFWLWWPVGLALLIYRLSTRRMSGRRFGRNGQWQFPDMCGYKKSFSFTPPSGNRAFDEYRSETLRRLEDEQKEFLEYLERLRQARDRQEFEQFMADRRQRPTQTDAPSAS